MAGKWFFYMSQSGGQRYEGTKDEVGGNLICAIKSFEKKIRRKIETKLNTSAKKIMERGRRNAIQGGDIFLVRGPVAGSPRKITRAFSLDHNMYNSS